MSLISKIWTPKRGCKVIWVSVSPLISTTWHNLRSFTFLYILNIMQIQCLVSSIVLLPGWWSPFYCYRWLPHLHHVTGTGKSIWGVTRRWMISAASTTNLSWFSSDWFQCKYYLSVTTVLVSATSVTSNYGIAIESSVLRHDISENWVQVPTDLDDWMWSDPTEM